MILCQFRKQRFDFADIPGLADAAAKQLQVFFLFQGDIAQHKVLPGFFQYRDIHHAKVVKYTVCKPLKAEDINI